MSTAPLDIKQVAERLGISEGSVYQLCAQRKLRHFRFGTGRGVIRVQEEDLQAYIESCKVEQQPATSDVTTDEGEGAERTNK